MTGGEANGAVAAGHEATAAAATGILRAGGNAFDAVVAGLAMACVAEPVLASPGGGGFLMALRAYEDRPHLVDFFGQTPRGKRAVDATEFRSVFADFGTARQEFHVGYGASATPGMLPGLAHIHARYCSRPAADLLAPAIRAARDGLTVTPFQAFLASVVEPILVHSQSARDLFAAPGRLPREGETFRNPDLGGFFERLAGEGFDAFLSGACADAMLEGQAGAGHLTPEDFAAYAVADRTPLAFGFNGAQVFLNPPPSAGGALIAAMIEASGDSGTARALAEADRLKAVHRADPAAILAAIGHAAEHEPAGLAAPRGTTHVSVIDAQGNAAAATVSNGEGNGHVASGCGFMVNNLLGEADLMPDGFHNWRPDRRLASMMAPTLVRFGDGRVSVLGSGGSNRIRSAVYQVIARHAGDGLDASSAVTAPRLHVEDGHLDFEDVAGLADREELVARFPDHRAWPARNLFFGGVHMVTRRADGSFDGAGDPRREGVFAVV